MSFMTWPDDTTPQVPDVQYEQVAAAPITNDTIRSDIANGLIPQQRPDQRRYVSEADAIIQWAQSQNLPPEYTAAYLRQRGYTPERLQQDMQFRTLLGERDNFERNRRLAELEKLGKVGKTVAEGFADPGTLWRGAGLPGTPDSPARIRADKEDRTRWEKHEDSEGNLWLIDKDRKVAPQPIILGNGEQARNLKELPTNELSGLRSNADQLVASMRAMGLLRGETVEGQRGDKDATGLKGFIWDPILQRADKAGVPTRAALGNIASLRIKERSGATVPAAEMAVLRPFIPRETDDPEVARTKLAQFLNEYAKMMESDLEYYKRAGRKVPVPLQNMINQAVTAARQVGSGALSAQTAIQNATNVGAPAPQPTPGQPGRKPTPQELIQMFLEAQRAGGGR